MLFTEAIIGGTFYCNYDYIKNIGIEKWIEIDEFYHLLGKMQGYDEDTINDMAFEFIEIYAYYNYFELSYKYMVSMAKKNYIWVYINENTFKWACKQNQGYQVISAMEDNLNSNKVSYGKTKDYESKISKLKELRGF